MSTVKRTIMLLVIAAVAVVGLPGCKEPTKPVKKLNIKRAADLEPIPPDPSMNPPVQTTSPDATVPSEEIEIVEVQGFRGECTSVFVGINQDNLVTMRSSSQVRTYRLAGLSIPDEMRFQAHNQIRVWLERRNVGVEVDTSAPGIDPAVNLFVCPDGLLINEELVRNGLALPIEGTFRRSEALKKASIEALTARRGVWGARQQ